MRFNRMWCCVVVLAVGSFLTTGVATAADRKADEILKDLEAAKKPSQSEVRDQKSYQAYLAASEKRATLIGELLKVDPDNKELDTLLPERWQTLRMDPKHAVTLTREMEAVGPKTKSEPIKAEIAFQKVIPVLRSRQMKKVPPAVEDFVKNFPKDERAPQILSMVASQVTDKAEKKKLLKRLATDFPDTQAGASAAGQLRQEEGVGKPFELSFKEAITDKSMSMKDLKGKVVVLDFWATWCGPCVAEMPKMKELYAKYHEKGVEFIGVSLDQPEKDGGLKSLKDFVQKNEIKWPQYYQGNFWNSEFSKSWGINSIPCVFVVDPDGNLYSVEARGKLEEMIPALLKKVKKTDTEAGAGAGF